MVEGLITTFRSHQLVECWVPHFNFRPLAAIIPDGVLRKHSNNRSSKNSLSFSDHYFHCSSIYSVPLQTKLDWLCSFRRMNQDASDSTIQFAPVLSLTSTGNLGYCHSKFPGINVCGLSVDVLCSCAKIRCIFLRNLAKSLALLTWKRKEIRWKYYYCSF